MLEKSGNRVFATRSRSRTAVVHLVREIYVRDGIPCGLAQCRRCAELRVADAAGFVRSLHANATRIVIPGASGALRALLGAARKHA